MKLQNEDFTLICKGGKQLKTSEIIARQSPLIVATIDSNRASHIDLQKIALSELEIIMEYCRNYIGAEAKYEQASSVAWRETDVSACCLGKIILAAENLQINHLIEEASKSIASLIKGRSVKEIRVLFNIADDIPKKKKKEISNDYYYLNNIYKKTILTLFNEMLLCIASIYIILAIELVRMLTASNTIAYRFETLIAKLLPKKLIRQLGWDDFALEEEHHIEKEDHNPSIKNERKKLTLKSISQEFQVCIPEVQCFPAYLQDKIWRHCSDIEVFRLQLSCEAFFQAIECSSWWRERLEKLVGAIDTSLNADWRKLYLAYCEQVKLYKDDKFWKRESLEIWDLPSFLGYESTGDIFCLTDDQSMLLGSSEYMSQDVTPNIWNYVNPKFVINQILVQSSSSKGICIKDKWYECIWNEPNQVIPPSYYNVRQLTEGREYTLNLKAVAFQQPVTLEIDIVFQDAVRNKKEVEIDVVGTYRELLETINKVWNKEMNDNAQGYFTLIRKVGTHRYHLNIYEILASSS